MNYRNLNELYQIMGNDFASNPSQTLDQYLATVSSTSNAALVIKFLKDKGLSGSTRIKSLIYSDQYENLIADAIRLVNSVTSVERSNSISGQYSDYIEPKAAGGGSVDEVIEIEIPYFYNDDIEGLDTTKPLTRIIEGKFTGNINITETEPSEIEVGVFIKNEIKTYKGLFELPIENDYTIDIVQQDISFTLTKIYVSFGGGDFVNLGISSSFYINESLFGSAGPRWETYTTQAEEDGNFEIHRFGLYQPFYGDGAPTYKFIPEQQVS